MSIKRQIGMTLIEMVMAMVIISIGLAGTLLAFSTVVKNSADPVLEKQMLAIAEEMIDEIVQKPFVPIGVAAGNGPKDCTSGSGIAPRSTFDDISDYDGYQTTGICNIDGDAVPALSGYNLVVAINAAATLAGLPGGSVKKISVTVSNGRESLNLNAWRTDFAS